MNLHSHESWNCPPKSNSFPRPSSRHTSDFDCSHFSGRPFTAVRQTLQNIEQDELHLPLNDSHPDSAILSQTYTSVGTCLRLVFQGFLRAEISLSFVLSIITPIIAAWLALPPPDMETSQLETIAEQFNRTQEMAFEGIRILRMKLDEISPPLDSESQPDDEIFSLRTGLPIFPDLSIVRRFPPPSSNLTKLRRDMWARVLQSIITNESFTRERTIIYSCEKSMKRQIFLICLSFRQHRSLPENIIQVKSQLSNTIENDQMWSPTKLIIEEDILAWNTEANRRVALKISRTLLTLPEQSWAWFVIYRMRNLPQSRSGKRTIDEISRA